MASNYTENYGLCQWEATDKVVHTEFNEDNAKIDAALGEKIGRCEPIDLPLREQTQHDRIYDLSDVDWSQWEYVLITFDLGKGYVYDDGHIRGLLNPESGNINCYCTNQGTHFIYSTIGPLLLTFLPLHDPDRKVIGVCSGISGLGIGSCTFRELSSISFNYDRSGQGMPPATVMAWGIR